MRTFAIVNQKGGCGKTTTAINLAGVFAGRGLRTLLVDMDPQGHCAAGLAIPEGRIDLHIGDAMLADPDRPVDPTRLLWRVSRNLDLAPATVRLAALEAARGELAGLADAERRLSRALARFKPQYDVCLIDCSPAIGMLAFNALVAADEVLVPVETGFFSLQGASKQISTIKAIGKRLGASPVHRVLPTMHDAGSVLSKDLLDELRRRFPGRVIPIVIRYDASLREAASFGQPVVEYAPDSPGAQDYAALADWLVEHSIRAGSVVEEEEDDPVPHSTPAPASPVQVVPGIGDRAIAGLVTHARAPHHAEPATEPAQPLALPGVRDALDPFSEAPPHAAAPAPATSRAADLANRAKRMQARASEQATVPLNEPVASPSHSTGPVRRFGVEFTPEGVLFSQPVTIGRNLAIAGDFNDWKPERTPLLLNDRTGRLEGAMAVQPGVWQYRLVVDGAWIADPYNPAVAPNPFGGTNSVLVVPAAGSGATSGGVHLGAVRLSPVSHTHHHPPQPRSAG